MRRQDREVNDLSLVKRFLQEESVMRIAFNDIEGLYLLPVNYGVEIFEDDITFYFHGSKEGRKASAFLGISQEPVKEVSIEIDGKHNPVQALGCDASFNYMSFMAKANAKIVEDQKEKHHALSLISSKLFDDNKLPKEFKISDATLSATLVVKLSVTDFSCKMNL